MASPPEQPKEPGEVRKDRGKTGLVVGIGVAAVLVVAGITLPLALDNGDDEQSGPAGGMGNSPATPSAQQDPIVDETDAGDGGSAEAKAVTRAAQQAVTALNNGDAELAGSIACDPENVGDDFGSDLPEGTRVRLVGTPSIDGDQARVPTEFAGHGSPSKTDMPVRKAGGDWCVVMTTTQ